MEVRRWPTRREPPPGWVLSPDLSEIYGVNVIVRNNSLPRARRDAQRARRERHSSALGQMGLGALLMVLGHRLTRR
jgi:hypothetical protein